MPRKCPFVVTLSSDERVILERLANKYTSPYRDVVRAKIILFASEGMENKDIAHRLSLPRQIVSKWRKRFFNERLSGLDDRDRLGRPPDFSPSSRSSGEGPSL